jgi:GNAT superfamily N-acetyltransferase
MVARGDTSHMGTPLATLPLAAGEVQLRRACRNDVAAIVDLLRVDPLGRSRELPRKADLGVYTRAFAAIDADQAQLLVVATAGGEVVGTFQLSFMPGLSRQGALRAQLEAVRVHDEYRSRGLGGAMIEWAISEARRRGCTVMQLTTDKARTDAHRFYERLGFIASHEGMKLAL